ncbi:MAG: hypothetical protein FWF05_09500 [Oscillospiraceae bacterium]|nr:hypothetical protein [Oscillospiraceae bacterium]
MSLSFSGYSENTLTLKADSSLTAAGGVVKVSANGAVSPCAAGNDFCGVVKSLHEGYAAVQTSGTVTVPYTGTAPAFGYAYLNANGSGGVKTGTNANRGFTVLSVDTAKLLVTILM